MERYAGGYARYAYDGAGNVTARVSVPSTGYTYVDTITYNDADLQAAETNSISTGTMAWSYDAGGRLVEIVDGAGDYTNYYYAAYGTLDGQTLPYSAGGTGDSFFYQTLDGDYRVTSNGCSYCATSLGANVAHTFTYQYLSLIHISAPAIGPTTRG